MSRKWYLKIQYDCGLGRKGEILSRHATYALAARAARRTGYYGFLMITNDEEG